MIEAAQTPDAVTLIRTAITLAAFLFLPGYLYFKEKNKMVEAVFFSVILLASIGIFLAFTMGVNELNLVAAYALTGGFWWTRKK